jgi:hypothetical protein
MTHLQIRREVFRAARGCYAARARYLRVRLATPGAEYEVQELFGAMLTYELALGKLIELIPGTRYERGARLSLARLATLKNLLHAEYNAHPASRARITQKMLAPRCP